MKLNTHFAKLHNRIPEYAPVSIKVVTHHHEEYDIDVLDPETGEPTGETEHVVNDWDTWEKKLFPTAEDYLKMGWLIVVDKAPPAEEGHSVRKTGFADEIDGKIVIEYEQVKYPDPPPRVFSKLKIVAAMQAYGIWDNVKAYIESEGLYDLFLAAQNFREDNEDFKEGKQKLQAAVGWTDEQVEALLAASGVD